MPLELVGPAALHIGAVASLGGVIYWVLGFDAMGAALGASGKALFNWHPVLMTAAFGVLLTEGVVAFRSSGLERPVKKTLHGVLHLVAVVLAAAGLWAVLKFHQEIKAPDFYSVHSYVGIAAVALLGLQFLFGAAFYALQLPAPSLRAAFMPSHKALGKLVHLAGVAALVSGLMQKQSFVRTATPADSFAPPLVFANAIAVIFLLTAAAVAFGLEGKPPAAPPQSDPTSQGLGEALMTKEKEGA